MFGGGYSFLFCYFYFGEKQIEIQNACDNNIKYTIDELNMIFSSIPKTNNLPCNKKVLTCPIKRNDKNTAKLIHTMIFSIYHLKKIQTLYQI